MGVGGRWVPLQSVGTNLETTTTYGALFFYNIILRAMDLKNAFEIEFEIDLIKENGLRR